MTAKPEKYPQGYFNDKPCKECSAKFSPLAPSHLYCTDACAKLAFTRKYLKKQYKITYEFYMEMYNKYGGKCHICKSVGFKIDPNQKLNLAVDHCHETGLVRGMLCHNCNRALGLFQDNTEYLRNAVEYLERATTILNGVAPSGAKRTTSEVDDDIV